MQYGHAQTVALLRQMLDEAREYIPPEPGAAGLVRSVANGTSRRLTQRQQSALRPVFNLTGTVLHTNLGRAIQAEAAVEAVTQAMRAPVTLNTILTRCRTYTGIARCPTCFARSPARKDARIVNNNAQQWC